MAPPLRQTGTRGGSTSPFCTAWTGTFGLLLVGFGRRRIDWGEKVVRRAPSFIRTQLNRIMWRELWIGVAIGEAIALLGLWGYAYLPLLAR